MPNFALPGYQNEPLAQSFGGKHFSEWPLKAPPRCRLLKNTFLDITAPYSVQKQFLRYTLSNTDLSCISYSILIGFETLQDWPIWEKKQQIMNTACNLREIFHTYSY